MSGALLQAYGANSWSSASATTIAKAFVSNVALNSIICGWVGWENAATESPTVSDSLGNTYTVIAHSFDSAYLQLMAFFWAKVTTAGACTVTTTFPGSRNYRVMQIAEFSGLDVSGGIVASAGVNMQLPTSTSTDATTSGTLTTLNADDFLVGFIQDGDGGTETLSVGTSFTSAIIEGSGSADIGGIEYRTVTTPATVAATWTVSAAIHSYSCAIAFKAATSGGVTVIPSGVSSASGVGTVTALAGAIANPMGNSSSSGIGNATVSLATNAPITGNSSASGIGSPSVLISDSALLVGNSATGQIGALTISGTAIIALTGNQSSSGVGNLNAIAAAIVSLSGISSMTGIGTISVLAPGGANVILTGVSGSGALGALTITGAALAQITGNSSISAIGTLTAVIGQTVQIPGISSTGEIGVITINAGAVISLSGNVSTGYTGNIVVPTTANIVWLDGAITIEPTVLGDITFTPSVEGAIEIDPSVNGTITIN